MALPQKEEGRFFGRKEDGMKRYWVLLILLAVVFVVTTAVSPVSAVPEGGKGRCNDSPWLYAVGVVAVRGDGDTAIVYFGYWQGRHQFYCESHPVLDGDSLIFCLKIHGFTDRDSVCAYLRRGEDLYEIMPIYEDVWEDAPSADHRDQSKLINPIYEDVWEDADWYGTVMFWLDEMMGADTLVVKILKERCGWGAKDVDEVVISLDWWADDAKFTAERPNDLTVSPEGNEYRVKFLAETPGALRISVYDAVGRVVHRLAERRVAPGEYSFLWRCDDSSGKPVPSGVYFIRASTGDEVSVAKVVVVR